MTTKREEITLQFHPRNRVGTRERGISFSIPSIIRACRLCIQFQIVFFLAISLTTSGCSPSPDAPSLRLGTNVWPGYEPFYLARDLNYFPANTIDLVEFLSASEVLRAFRNNAIEAAALTLDEALVLLDQTIPVKIVLVTDFSAGADVIISKANIGKVADLTGKRVGVEGSALGAYVISRALDIHNVDIGSIDIVHLNVNEHETAFLNDQIDAVVTFEPVRSKLLPAGGREIFTSREIPEEIVDVIIVHERIIEEHPNQVRALVDGWFRALQYLSENPDDAAKRMSARLVLTPALVLDSFDGLSLPSRQKNEALLGGRAPGLMSTVNRMKKILIEKELLGRKLKTDNLLTAQALGGDVR